MAWLAASPVPPSLPLPPDTLLARASHASPDPPGRDERAFKVLPVEEVDAFLVAISERD